MIHIMPDFVDRLSKMTERDRNSGPARPFSAGDPVRSLFLVAAGEIRLIRMLPHGSELTLQRARAGAVLAEASLFASRYHCDATAGENSVLHVVPVQRTKAALREDSALANALARHLAQELRRTRTKPKYCRSRQWPIASMPG